MPSRPFSTGPRPPHWRDRPPGQRKAGARRRPLPLLLAVLTVVALAAAGGLKLRPVGVVPPPPSASETIARHDLRSLLDGADLGDLTERTIRLPVDGRLLQVETTIDLDLQRFLLEKLDRRHARQIGIVVMEGETGRILALAGFDKDDPARNPCLSSDFPAASVFKIVTAAGAIDQCGLSADSPVHFNGTKHTLYKRQLTDAVNRYTNTMSFEEAFAESVNPVFGRLGQARLGKPLLEQSAAAFGFNAAFDLDLPLPPSRFEVSDQPYNWAEAASGFNRDTTLSPLHGAMMVTAVLNGGRMVAPAMVDRVVDAGGRILYRAQPAWQEQAMSSGAAAELAEMMEATITSGTARKAFRRHRRDKVLSRLEIGGKTGSMGGETADQRYDWFVGFAREREGAGQIAIGVLVVHDKLIGIRAADYARFAISRYFGQHSGKSFAENRRESAGSAG